jgi:hypothetical protein
LEKKKRDEWLTGDVNQRGKQLVTLFTPVGGKHELWSAWGLSEDEVLPASIGVMAHARFGA